MGQPECEPSQDRTRDPKTRTWPGVLKYLDGEAMKESIASSTEE